MIFTMTTSSSLSPSAASGTLIKPSAIIEFLKSSNSSSENSSSSCSASATPRYTDTATPYPLCVYFLIPLLALQSQSIHFQWDSRHVWIGELFSDVYYPKGTWTQCFLISIITKWKELCSNILPTQKFSLDMDQEKRNKCFLQG